MNFLGKPRNKARGMYYRGAPTELGTLDCWASNVHARRVAPGASAASASRVVVAGTVHGRLAGGVGMSNIRWQLSHEVVFAAADVRSELASRAWRARRIVQGRSKTSPPTSLETLPLHPPDACACISLPWASPDIRLRVFIFATIKGASQHELRFIDSTAGSSRV